MSVSSKTIGSATQPQDAGQLSSDDFSGIRSFQDTKKEKEDVRFIVGAAIMEGCRRMNQKTYLHPVTLLFYIALSLGIDYYMGYGPKPDVWWSPATLAIGFGAAAIPLLVGVEFINRNYFESLLRLTLGSTDLLSIPTFYSVQDSKTSSATTSGFWSAVHRGRAIGCIALDGSTHALEKLSSVIPGEVAEKGLSELVDWMTAKPDQKKGESAQEKDIENVVKETSSKLRKREVAGNKTERDSKSTNLKTKPAPNPSGIARIRHFAVDTQYRSHGLGKDLLNTAVQHAFAPKTGIERIVVYQNAYATPASQKLFTTFGFKPASQDESKSWPSETVGIGPIRFSGNWLVLTRAHWEASRK